MSIAAGIETWGGGSKRIRFRRSKQEVITEISTRQGVKSLDLYPLTLKELDIILSAASTEKWINIYEIPSGAFKIPLLNILSPTFPDVGLEKLTLSTLRELIGAFNQ